MIATNADIESIDRQLNALQMEREAARLAAEHIDCQEDYDYFARLLDELDARGDMLLAHRHETVTAFWRAVDARHPEHTEE